MSDPPNETPRHTPKDIGERADDVSVALLMRLERLPPAARAAFLLHEVFGADYGEIAALIGQPEATCRRLVSDAKARLRDERPR